MCQLLEIVMFKVYLERKMEKNPVFLLAKVHFAD